MSISHVDSAHLRREAKKYEVAFPERSSSPYGAYCLWHPLFLKKDLPIIRPNCLLVSSANPYGERESGIYLHEVDRPMIFATILAIPYEFSLFTGMEDYVRYLQPGNTVCYSRFHTEPLGSIPDKDGRLFRVELLNLKDIEAYFDGKMVELEA